MAHLHIATLSCPLARSLMSEAYVIGTNKWLMFHLLNEMTVFKMTLYNAPNDDLVGKLLTDR